MPTYRLDLKLGTTVPQMKTDDYNDKSVTSRKLADGAVTADKLSGNILDELRKKINSTVSIDNLDTLHQEERCKAGQSIAYNVTDSDKNVGVLFLFPDAQLQFITQVFITHCAWKDGAFQKRNNTYRLHCYYRSYNNNSVRVSWDIGTWNTWKPFVDAEVQDQIDNMWQSYMNPIDDGDINTIWNNDNV